jgi:hypothetical protein
LLARRAPANANPVESLVPADLELVAAPDLQEPEVKPSANAGGGTIEPGLVARASGESPVKARQPAAIQPTPKAPPVKVVPRAAEAPDKPDSLLHGQADEPAPEDLFALDQLLTADSSADAVPSQPRPKPVFVTSATVPVAAVAMAGKQAAPAKHFGSGSGSGGGPGGNGHGFGGMSDKDAELFGGEHGAFRGQVCPIPVGTPSIKSLGRCQPIKEIYTDTFNIPSRSFKLGFPGLPGQNEWFAILYTGSFIVKRSGLYHFRLSSDDGSILQIDDQLVIDNDGNHAPLSRRGALDLSEGKHELRLRYFQGPRTLVALQLFVTPPGRGEHLFRPAF